MQLNPIATHLDVLARLPPRFPIDTFDWAVTGSLGQRLHGVPLNVHDMDLQTDETAAWELDRLLSNDVIDPLAWRTTEQIHLISATTGS